MTDDLDSAPGAQPASAGALLREAREKQGLHIAALAASIKVAPRKLDALENDRWSELPDATFTRALAQTVCRTLKIDPKPVLDLLPALGHSTFDRRGAALNEPLRERMGRGDPAMAGSAIRPMVWAAAGLMVAALALYFFPRGTGIGTEAGPARSDGAASAVAPAAPTPTLPASSTQVGAVPAALAAAAAAEAASAATSSAVPAPAGTAVLSELDPVVANKVVPTAGASTATMAAVVAAAANLGTTPAASPVPQLSLSASRATWVDVRDARGQVLISRTLSAGETVGLEGPAPLRVAIGNAAAVQLVFRGQPFDVASRTRDNVARFELQ